MITKLILTIVFSLFTSISFAQVDPAAVVNDVANPPIRQSFYSESRLEGSRFITRNALNELVPPVALDGYINAESKQNFLFKRGYHLSYPKLLIYDNKIMMNPFLNRTGSQASFKNVNNLYFLEQSNLVTNGKTFVDQTPGTLFINSLNDDNRSLSFTSNRTPDHFMHMNLHGTEDTFLFCPGNAVACANPLLSINEAGNVGIGHPADTDLTSKLDVNGLIQVEGPIFAKIGGIPHETAGGPYVLFFNLYNYNLNPDFWFDEILESQKDTATDASPYRFHGLADPRGLAELGVIGIDFLRRNPANGEIEDTIISTSGNYTSNAASTRSGEFRFMFRGGPRNICTGTHLLAGNTAGHSGGSNVFQKERPQNDGQNNTFVYFDSRTTVAGGEADAHGVFAPWMCARFRNGETLEYNTLGSFNAENAIEGTFWDFSANKPSKQATVAGAPIDYNTNPNNFRNPHVGLFEGARWEPYASRIAPYPWYLEKPFIINHPQKKGHYLIHKAIEGNEVGVFYRGQGKLNKGKTQIEIPPYIKNLTNYHDITIHLTAINSADRLITLFKNGQIHIKDNKFTVISQNPSSATDFYWELKAKRFDNDNMKIEPLKNNYKLNGQGPYRYLTKRNDQ